MSFPCTRIRTIAKEVSQQWQSQKKCNMEAYDTNDVYEKNDDAFQLSSTIHSSMFFCNSKNKSKTLLEGKKI